jgi:hypothetical protein
MSTSIGVAPSGCPTATLNAEKTPRRDKNPGRSHPFQPPPGHAAELAVSTRDELVAVVELRDEPRDPGLQDGAPISHSYSRRRYVSDPRFNPN